MVIVIDVYEVNGAYNAVATCGSNVVTSSVILMSMGITGELKGNKDEAIKEVSSYIKETYGSDLSICS